MDPKAVLDSIKQALKDGDPAQAAEFLFNYFEWRLKEGFEPPGGDDRAAELVPQVLDALNAKHPAAASSADPPEVTDPVDSITAEEVLGEIMLYAKDPGHPRPKVLLQTTEQRAIARHTGQLAVAHFRKDEKEAREIRNAVKGKVQLLRR